MRNYLIVSLVALACVGCASNRMDNDWFSTAGTQFSIRKDPIVPVKPRLKEKAKKKQAGADGKKLENTYYANPSLEKMITKYYERSQQAENLEVRTKDGEQIEAKPQSPYANALIDYRAAGFDASRGICEYALNRLGEAHSDYRFANKSFNVGSGAVSSLMGIFQASAKSIAVTATSTALLQAWSQDFEEYAYLTASIGTVGEKVKAAQDTYRKGVEGFATDPADSNPKVGPKGKYDVISPRSWGDATLQIQQYNSFCLATGMRALIEKAVGKADVYFDSKTGSVEFFSTQNVAQLKLAIRQKELLGLQQEISEGQRTVVNAKAIRDNGNQAIQQAKLTVAQLQPKVQAAGLYDPTTKVVDLGKAETAVSVADAAAKSQPPPATAAADLKTAQAALAQAEDLQKAMNTLAEYDNAAWQTAASARVSDAEAAVEALRKKLDAPSIAGV
jgi:hypothetical protein